MAMKEFWKYVYFLPKLRSKVKCIKYVNLLMFDSQTPSNAILFLDTLYISAVASLVTAITDSRRDVKLSFIFWMTHSKSKLTDFYRATLC